MGEFEIARYAGQIPQTPLSLIHEGPKENKT